MFKKKEINSVLGSNTSFFNVPNIRTVRQNKETESKEEKTPKILFVEGGKFVASAYKEGLEEEGFKVEIASNGVEAMQKIREFEPALVLLDLLLSKKNGFEVLEEMRMDSTLQHIPVVILTDLDNENDIQRVKELGVVDYLIKSLVSMKDVIDSVRRGVGKR